MITLKNIDTLDQWSRKIRILNLEGMANSEFRFIFEKEYKDLIKTHSFQEAFYK